MRHLLDGRSGGEVAIAVPSVWNPHDGGQLTFLIEIVESLGQAREFRVLGFGLEEGSEPVLPLATQGDEKDVGIENLAHRFIIA